MAESTGDTDRSPRTVAVALTATTAVQAVVTMATLTVSVYAPQAAKDIGVAPEAIGVYASLTYVGAMIGTLTTAGFVLRFGAIRVTHVGREYIIFDWSYQTDPGNPELSVGAGIYVASAKGFVVKR